MSQTSPAIVDLLKQKAKLLLKREQEAELLHRARDRTAAWVGAFHRVMSRPSTGSLEEEWTRAMIEELRFQSAAIYRKGEVPGHLELVVGLSHSPLPGSLMLQRPIHEHLEENREGACQAPSDPRLIEVSIAFGMGTFLWFHAPGPGDEEWLLVAGFDLRTGQSQASRLADDLRYFTMLGRHLGILVRNERLLADLEAERAELRVRNAQYADANRQLEASLRETRDTHAQLLQASKMAAVGQLAAGVSHEINNPLAVILGFAQGLERRLTATTEHLRLPVTSIVREALRCKNLVQDLLTFSRTANRSVEPTDPVEALESAGRLLESRARTQETDVALEVEPGTPRILANRTQLEQVLVNLGINALDAIERGGRVVLRIRRWDAVSVALEVSDDGPGIPEEIRQRIFEPFFTTKAPGKGTGLGLSLVYQVVQQHGGAMDVESKVGAGTTMRVRLPAGAAQAADPRAPGAAP
jgi:signal transduction histidine kinase